MSSQHGLLKYFKRTNEVTITPKAREMAAKEVKKVEDAAAEAAKAGMKRGHYSFLSDDNKAKIAKHALDHGVTTSIRHFTKTKEFTELKESTVRGWVKLLKEDMQSVAVGKSNADKSGYVSTFAAKKQGRPLLVGEDVEGQVREFIKESRATGSVVNTTVVIAAATGIVKAKDPSILLENGGYLDLSKEWAQRLMSRMGLVKRKGSTAAKITAESFDRLKEQFLTDIETISKFENIPKELVINWDQTAVKYVPVSNWTQEFKGSKRVPIVGIDDKRQITATLTVTATGDMLPAQVKYGGKTPACLPNVTFPTGWHITYTPNHWANEDTMVAYIHNILLPYVVSTREKLQFSNTFPALVLFDHFKAQLTDRVLDILDSNNILVIDVPANCTDRLQPLDVSVNKSVKHHLRDSFQLWYSKEVQKQQGPHKPVELKLSALKPLGAQWFVEAVHHVQMNKQIIINGFDEAGITDKLN